MVDQQDNSYKSGVAPTQQEALDPQLSLLFSLNKSLGLNSKALGKLQIPLNMFIGTLKGFASDAIQLQRQSLAFNKNFSDAVNINSDKIGGLPGGLKTSLESVMSFQREGFFNVSKETLNLANTMKITGQSLQALVGINKKLATLGTLSRSQISSLNKTILENSLTYGVTSESLIGSINNLNEGLTVLGFTGGAGATTEALTKLSARFPALGDTMGALTNEILKGDTGQLARLGLFEDVNRLISTGAQSDEDLKRIFEKIATNVAGFAPGATGIVGQRARMDFAGPIGIMAKQVADGFKEFARDPQQERQAKIFEDFRTAMETLFLPIAEQVGKLATNLANMVTSTARFINNIIPLEHAVQALTSAMLTSLAFSRINAGRQLAAQAAGGAAAVQGVRLLKVFTPVGLAISAGIFALTSLLGNMSTSVDNLAEAEADRAKAEISKLRDDINPTRFEGLTRILINSQAAQFETLNAARTNDMIGFTNDVVAAVDRTTTAVDDSAPSPIFRRRT